MWFSTYYENKLKNMSIEYDTKKEITGKAVLEDANETVKLKEVLQKDKEFFENKYYELNTENEELRKERDRLQLEFNSLKGQLESQKERFDKLDERFKQVQDSLMKVNEQLSKKAAQANELCRRLKNYGEEC